MQGIVLCPKCQVRAVKDNLGEFLCPKCGIRLCPKAHIVDGKICQYCGWEDPNYYLWEKAKKARPQSSEVAKSGHLPDSKPQQVCPKCGIAVDPTSGRCSGCGWLYGSKPRVTQEPAISATPTPISEPRRRITSVPYEPTHSAASQPSTSPPQSPLLHEIKRARPRERDFTPVKRFLQPVGASLLVCVVLIGVFILIKEFLIPVFSQPAGKTSPETPAPSISIPAKLYTLNTRGIPEGGGTINRSPEMETYPAGTQITLTAIPNECYEFSYWEGATSNSSEEPSKTTIKMDSDKTVVAHFSPKDTTPPAISEVEVPKYTDISATITWKTNDEPATSQVEYGKTDAYGLNTPLNKEFVTNHSVPITGLEPNKTYYFRVKSTDKCGNEANPSPGKLTTLDTVPVGHEVGQRPPDFTLQEYQDDNPDSPNNGETVSLSDYRGKKILLNFWDTFCGACIGEFPGIREIYGKYGKNEKELIVITICMDGRADRIKALEEKYKDAEDKYFGKVGNLTFPILLDVEEKTGKSYDIWIIPCTVFIDKNGIIREINTGRFTSIDEIASKLDSLD